MEQGGAVGSTPSAGVAGGTTPPKTEGSTAPATSQAAQPQGGMVPPPTHAQDRGKEEPGKEKAAGEAGGGKAKPVGEAAPAAPEPRDGGKAAPSEEAASAAQHDGGQAASVKERGPAAPRAQHQGKDGPAEGKAPTAAKAQDGGKDKPGQEKVPTVGEAKGGQAEPAGARDGGKDEPRKEQAEAERGKEKPTEAAALAAAQAQDGGKEEPAKGKAPAPGKEKAPAPGKEKGPAPAKEKGKEKGKEEAPAPEEKVPAAGKAPDGEKKAAKAEKAPADKKPAKEKAPAAAEAREKENKVAKAEEAPAAKMAQDGGKEEPVKEKAAAPEKEQPTAPGKEKAAAPEKEQPAAPGKEKAPAPEKEKAPAPAKVQDGGKEAAKVEPPKAAAEAGAGGEEPTEAAAMATARAAGDGEKAAKVEETKQQQPRSPKAPRPALLQSLSCPAACQREEQPWPEAAVMEMIPEEPTAAESKEGLTEPGPALPAPGALQPPGPVGTPGSPQERTLPHAVGQNPDAAGATQHPGSGGQASLTEAEPPPSPYLTPDFGKEDPFEILDDVPPPPAPFEHRIVTLRSASVSSQFNLSSKDILGGGKFGEVHTCTEKETGLKLAAKVIRKQGAKDKEMVLLEIDVMNQLNHRNLIQLYDAIETPREIILFMEFVEGGELFERIIDDDYQLTEVDCMVFVRQICEGIRFMHHMRVLHLDLKPENILCVAATGHMVKIIDFGLARRYNPQEKLKVNFGTPEFLSPEVVNYEQVSYSTDMWSMGVITYMLLSGLSPFLGDNDTETLNNVLAANWYFDEETFESVSDEAKDFVSNLIIKEKSARMSAGQCLQHPWLNNLAEKAKRCNRRLKSQVLLKKYVMRRRWKKNFIGVCAANRFKKITSSGSLTALGV
ncbi:myosin light chain kinase 2, skeletal/cardiac muscle [Porphyrio hochstetteri]